MDSQLRTTLCSAGHFNGLYAAEDDQFVAADISFELQCAAQQVREIRRKDRSGRGQLQPGCAADIGGL